LALRHGRARLVAYVLAVQLERRRGCLVPHDNIAATRAGVGRALVGRAAELGDDDGLALGFTLGDEGADERGELGGDLRVSVAGVRADVVEWRPVDALERERGVADLAAEPLADCRDGPGEELVHTGRERGEQLTEFRTLIGEHLASVEERLAGHEAFVHQAELRAGDDHDLGPLAAESFAMVGALGEQCE